MLYVTQQGMQYAAAESTQAQQNRSWHVSAPWSMSPSHVHLGSKGRGRMKVHVMRDMAWGDSGQRTP